MSVLRGHEDLQPKAIVGFDMGFALVECGGVVRRYRVTILPGGGFHGEPVEEQPNMPDQVGPELRARSIRTVDQM